MNKLRIAMLSVHTCPLAVLGGKEAGGMNVYVRELSKELGRRDIQVDVFTRSQNPITTLTHNLGTNARIIHLPAGPLRPYDKNQVFNHLPQFVENIRVFNQQEANGAPYDIVHGHYWLSGWAGLMLRRKWKAPVVQMFHTLGHLKNDIARNDDEREPLFRAEREGDILQRVDRVIAATPVEKAQMAWRYGADSEKIEIIPCGVDLKLFRPIPYHDARAVVAERVPELRARQIVLLVGRIEPIKGVDILIDAVKKLCQQSSETVTAEDLQVLIVGGGSGIAHTRSGRSLNPQATEPVADNPETLRLRRQVEEAGLGEVVLFVNSQPQEMMPYFYSAADVSVMSSRYESFGMAALEAQACGTPVIASQAGGLPYVVQPGVTGYLFETGNSGELAYHLDTLLTNDALRLKLGHQAVIHAEEFGWRNVADKMLEVYSQLSGAATRDKIAALV